MTVPEHAIHYLAIVTPDTEPARDVGQPCALSSATS
jgi:hypothetical protein